MLLERLLSYPKILLSFMGLLSLYFMPANLAPLNALESVHLKGKLKVLVEPSELAISQEAHPTNVVIELLRGFANELHVKLELDFVNANQNGAFTGYDLVAMTPRANQFITADLLLTQPLEFLPYQPFPPESQNAASGVPYILIWGVAPLKDRSLFLKAAGFLKQAAETGVLAELQSYFFMNTPESYYGSQVFLKRAKRRLNQYLPAFKEAGQANQIDWRLLAAMAYQESHWNPKAVSPTGVRGMMMLTQDTAQEVGIKNRNDATESIRGGAAYFKKIKSQLPAYIREPDRTWLALAAYNMGIGNVMKSIQLTEYAGEDASNWFKVRKQLSRLDTDLDQRGYLQGSAQARKYVSNIRLYYDILSRPDLVFESEQPIMPIHLALAQ